MAIRKRLSWGVAASALGQAVQAFYAVGLVPFFMRSWGAEGYGRWLTLTALVSYLSFLELGGQNYIANLLAVHHVKGEVDSFRKRLSEGVSLFLFMGIAAYALVIVVLFAFVLLPWPGAGYLLATSDAWVLAILSAFTLLLAIPAGVYASAYRSAGLFVRGSLVANGTRIVGMGVSIALLYFRVSPVVYAAGFFGIGFVLTMIIVWDASRFIPGCRGLRVSLRAALDGWRHLEGSLHFWLIGIAQGVIQQGVVIVLSLFGSATLVAVYATHRSLASFSGYIGVLLQAPILPELSFLWAQGRLADLRRTTALAIRAVTFLTGAGAIFLWIFVPLIFSWWTRSQLDLQPALLAVLLIQGVLAAGWSTSTWSLLAVNRHRPVALWSLVNAVLTVTLASCLAPAYGPLGVAAACLVGDCACGLRVYPALAASFLEVPARTLYAQLAFAMLALVPIATCVYLASLALQGWWLLAAYCLIGVAAAYPAIVFVGWGFLDKDAHDNCVPSPVPGNVQEAPV